MYHLTEIPKFIKVVTYAHSYNHVANNVRRLKLNWNHLIPKLDETPEYTIHVILPPKFFTASFFFSQYIRHNHLTCTSKLFKPVHLPTPNCNQRCTPFHSLSSSWQRSTYMVLKFLRIPTPRNPHYQELGTSTVCQPPQEFLATKYLAIHRSSIGYPHHTTTQEEHY